MLLENWTETAKEAGLSLWERQPVESDLEWRVWRYYMDSYPCVEKPTFSQCAKDLNLQVKDVSRVYRMWDFDMRLQAWAKHIDTLNLDKRAKALVEMNEKHISMASKINEKLAQAIEKLDVENIKPSDFKGLMQMATDLERKSRIDVIDAEKLVPKESSTMEKPVEKTSHSDLQQVLEILQATGVLKTVGIKQTTEVLCRDD